VAVINVLLFLLRFWAYNAGHVLGAAMFMIEIAGEY
jgi:cleavage and polyadenylation specificity factor subunit 3